MPSSEVPQTPPVHRHKEHALLRLWHGMQAIGTRIKSLLDEDPAMRAVINRSMTKDFVRRFAAEFERMMRESREGAEGMRRLVKVGGWGHGEDMFDIVLRDMLPAELKNLPQPYYAEVIQRLRSACGLRTG